MNKKLFISALVVLVAANILVYSCKKENAITPANPVSNIVTLEDRNAGVCPQLTVTNGIGLSICGIDGGTATCASVCGGSNNAAAIGASPAVYGFSGSTFSISNPGANAVPVALSFNCATMAAQVFWIPAGGSLTFRVAPDANGCCQAVSPC